MKLGKVVTATGLALVVGALPAVAEQNSGSAEPSYLKIVPSRVGPGQSVATQGHCNSPYPKNAVDSAGFAQSVPLGASAKVVDKPGKYVATMKCKDGTVTASFEVVGAEQGRISVQPSEVAPGGKLTVTVWCLAGPGDTKARSLGFAADIPVNFEGNNGKGVGAGTAAAKPGKYSVIFACKGQKIATTFTITKPPPTNPNHPTPQPPQVSVKPKGAPQTGGGFLAN
ncbi:hypothetical protein [Actinocrispum sp. NPDC049592]|uniref:hypothetical protein n=1 Tax=Actinocrispum sp. NPDC049592 TaxID=3154835 RepID=UPI00342F5D07